MTILDRLNAFFALKLQTVSELQSQGADIETINFEKQLVINTACEMEKYSAMTPDYNDFKI